MKKLCNHKPTKRVHPSPTTAHPAHLLSFLPAAILSLATALSSEDQQVLAYLLSSSDHPNTTGPTTRAHHRADPTCGCFSCYKSFWERWDASPDRHVIHLIIDAVEQRQVEEEEEFGHKRRNRRRRGGRKRLSEEEDRKEILPATGHVADDDEGEDEKDGGDEGKSKGSSVTRLVSFVGERVWPWGLWN